MRKPTVKSVTEEFKQWRLKAKDYIFTLKHPQSRTICNITAAEPDGKLNGLTVVELLAMVNMASQQGEKLYLHPVGKSVSIMAVKDSAFTPQELQ